MQTTSWQTGYCVNVDVQNTNATAATWAIDLAVDGFINNLWNAKSSEGAGDKRRFVGVEWNQTLAPNSTTSFGYCAER